MTDLSCDAVVLRGYLKHSWLENQVLNKSSEDLVYLRSLGRWEALEAQFPARIADVIDLASGLEQSFSPAQLITRLSCFSDLDRDLRSRLIELVHDAYASRAKSLFESRSVVLFDLSNSLERAFAKLQINWKHSTDSELKATWHEVLDIANDLRNELGGLPTAVVLP